jgi:phospholipid/cholesterol/gamma-HCH transport system substrate-binding protein
MLARDSRVPFRAFQSHSALFLLGGLMLFLGVLALWSYRQGWFQTNLKVALISNSSLGLVPGTPVRVSGMRVGLVEDLELLPDGRVRISLKIDDRFRAWVTPRSRAYLARPSLLGSGGVDITPAPMAGQKVPDQFSIPAANVADLESFLAGATTTQSDLQSLIRSTNQIAAKELPHTIAKLSTLLSVANQVGSTVQRSLPPTVDHLQGTLLEGRQTTKLFQRELPATMKQVRDTLSVISQTGGTAEQAARQSQQTMQQLQPELTRSLQQLNQVMGKIQSLAARLDSFMDTGLQPAPARRGEREPAAPISRDSLSLPVLPADQKAPSPASSGARAPSGKAPPSGAIQP